MKNKTTIITFCTLCVLVLGSIIFFIIRGTETAEDRIIGKQYLEQMRQSIDFKSCFERIGTVLRPEETYYFSNANESYILYINVEKFNGVPLEIEKYMERHTMGKRRKLVVQKTQTTDSSAKYEILYEKQWD